MFGLYLYWNSLQIVGELAGATIGPSIPAFLTLYFTRYSPQARSTDLLNVLEISKVVNEKRTTHYIAQLEPMIEIVSPHDQTITLGYYTLDFLDPFKLKEARNNENYHVLRNHLAIEKMMGDTFPSDRFLNFDKEVVDHNESVHLFLNKISSDVLSKGDDLSLPHGSDIQYQNLLLALWRHCASANESTPSACVDDLMPRTDLENGLNTFGGVFKWEFSSYLSVTSPAYSFQLSVNTSTIENSYKLYNAIRESYLLKTRFDEYLKLESERKNMKDFSVEVRAVLERLKRQIDGNVYKGTVECCPHSTFDVDKRVNDLL